MPVSFDWEFEDEPNSPPPSRKPGSTRRSNRRWLRLSFVAFVLFSIIGLSVHGWVSTRLKEAEQSEGQLRDLVELEIEAIVNDDPALFRARQDPDDPRWQEEQLARYISPQNAGFEPLPGLIPAKPSIEIERVDFLGRASHVDLLQKFQTWPSWQDELSSTLTLKTTWFYQQKRDGNWYHVAPPQDHLGVHYTWRGNWLDVRASEFGAELIEPAAQDWMSLINQACQLLDCPQRQRYTLSFGDVSGAQVHGNRWALPALYLTGLPQDDAARAAWQHAVQLWLIEALVKAQPANQVVSDRIFYGQLVKRLQVELGLTEPASPDAEILISTLAKGELHTWQKLWRAQYTGEGIEDMRVFEAEVEVLLQVLEANVGVERLFALFPALHRQPHFDTLLSTLYELDPDDFEQVWTTYLSALTNVSVLSENAASLPDEPPLITPLLPPPSTPPGDQIAMVCDGAIWVSNLDGSDLFQLTPDGEHFTPSVYWSPDGRWLLTSWRSNTYDRLGAPFLLAADGNGGRFVLQDTNSQATLFGWSPDGREVIYSRRVPSSSGTSDQVYAASLESGQVRQLPGLPFWSPDGQQVVYNVSSPTESLGDVWLAEVGSQDWENPRLLVENANMASEQAWSPDGSKLALTLDNQDPKQGVIAIYDLTSGQLHTLVTLDDFLAALADVPNFKWGEFDNYRSVVKGWSADAKHLLIQSSETSQDTSGGLLSFLMILPLDGLSPPRIFMLPKFIPVAAAWSPTNPQRLAFDWSSLKFGSLSSVLYDLQVGPIYTSTFAYDLDWSPDGNWLAWQGADQVGVIDQAGNERIIFESTRRCEDIALNPVADWASISLLQDAND